MKRQNDPHAERGPRHQRGKHGFQVGCPRRQCPALWQQLTAAFCGRRPLRGPKTPSPMKAGVQTEGAACAQVLKQALQVPEEDKEEAGGPGNANRPPPTRLPDTGQIRGGYVLSPQDSHWHRGGSR